jgi:hypothetical protein
VISTISTIGIWTMALAGCSSSLRRPEVDLGGVASSPGDSGASGIDLEIDALLGKGAAAPFPGRIGVARIAGQVDAERRGSLVTLAQEERRLWQRALGAPRVSTDVRCISSLLSPASGIDLRRLRLEAARLQAEFLMLYRLESDEDAHNTPLSMLYATLIGLCIVPGTVYENCTVGKCCLS